METSALEARQPLKNEQRSEASANELAALMQEAKAAQAMTAMPSNSAAHSTRHRRVPRHSRASLLEHAARSRPRPRSRKRQSMRPRKQKQAAESTIAELRQSLQQEQKKTAALMQEVNAAQAMTASAEQQRRALDEAQARAAALASELAGTRREIETQAAQSQKAVDAATKQKQAAEGTIAELRQSLQQERDRTEAMARDLASGAPWTTRDGWARGGQPRRPGDTTVEAAVTEPPKAAEAQGNAEAAKLIARASALLGQGISVLRG